MTNPESLQNKNIASDKAPDELVFNLRKLKNGRYRIEGKPTATWWKALCQEVGVPEAGGGEVDLVLDVSLPRFRIFGDIKSTMQRQCVRSLELFEHRTDTHIDEHLTLQPVTDDGGEIYHESDTLDMGEYLRQQFVLAMDPHPIKGGGERGGVILSDGLDEEAESESSNPFAALKEKFPQE